MLANGIPLVADKYLPNGTMDLLDLNDWAMQMSDFEWMDADVCCFNPVLRTKLLTRRPYTNIAILVAKDPLGRARLSGISGH